MTVTSEPIVRMMQDRTIVPAKLVLQETEQLAKVFCSVDTDNDPKTFILNSQTLYSQPCLSAARASVTTKSLVFVKIQPRAIMSLNNTLKANFISLRKYILFRSEIYN